MTTDNPEKREAHISVARRVHRFLKRHFPKLHGIGGGSFLMLWLSIAGMSQTPEVVGQLWVVKRITFL